jgi:hypothetical protein
MTLMQPAVDHEPRRFAQRLIELREEWSDTRRAVAWDRQADRASQFKTLRLIYQWCAEMAAQIACVYGPELPVDQTPMPRESDPRPEFALLVGMATDCSRR